MLEGGAWKIRMLMSGRDVGVGDRRIRMQVSGRDVDGWGEENQNAR